jgi:hypothetical protein
MERMERRGKALPSMKLLFALFLGEGRNIFPMPTFHMSQSMFFNVANVCHFVRKKWPTTTTQLIFLKKMA